jgi:hypothetical protein
MTRSFDRTKTLDELDPPAWGEPTYDSYLVSRCHALRRKKLCDFSIEDLRAMIGQGIGLRFLIPVAMDVLERDPLAEGEFYPGDLLGNVLRAEPSFWAEHGDCRDRVESLVASISIPQELIESLALFRKQSAGPRA